LDLDARCTKGGRPAPGVRPDVQGTTIHHTTLGKGQTESGEFLDFVAEGLGAVNSHGQAAAASAPAPRPPRQSDELIGQRLTERCAPRRTGTFRFGEPSGVSKSSDDLEVPTGNAAVQSAAAAANLPVNERGKFMSHVTIETNMISHRVPDVYNNYFAEMRDLVNVVRGRRGLHVHQSFNLGIKPFDRIVTRL